MSKNKKLFIALIQQGYSRSCLRNIKRKALNFCNYQKNEEGKILRGFYPCDKKCSTCVTYGIKTTSINYPGGSKIINQHLTCQSRNAIYVIQCRACSKYYVGETKNNVKARIVQHLSSIKIKKNTSVSRHFNSPNHSIKDFTFFVLMNNVNWNDLKRKTMENKWIKNLQSLHPRGINAELNRNFFKFISLPFVNKRCIPLTLTSILNKYTKTCFTIGPPLRTFFSHKHEISRTNQQDESN